MQGSVFAGTSGYSYKEWKGTFYPDDLPHSRFLSFYASRFGSVEINNTFYRFPTESALEAWAAETPPEFRFAIKANQRITHRQRLKNVEEATHQFVARCRILGDRLGPILFQLPPQLQRNDARLIGFLEGLPEGGRYAVEFRHRSWLEPDVFRALEDAGVAVVQSEDGKLTTPRVATADFCYVRLRRDVYGEDDLDDWRRWIADRTGEGRDVYAYLKHDERGNSPEPVLGRLNPDRS